ncbi:MAG: GGDEF domain-containing phosphodiesterase [Gammaproteobacteria bacterium]|nr:GGDEF domain-containing phosphodiesterase [Gammaproteobacteria bacterium]
MHEPHSAHFRYSLLLREIIRLHEEPDVASVGLLLVRLEELDIINERLGYLAGDKVLEDYAGRVEAVARDQDRTFEINGACYALLIRNPEHNDHVLLAAQKILRSAEEPTMIGGEKAWVKVRIGLSLCSETGTPAEDLLRQAEFALRAARESNEPFVQFSGVLEDTQRVKKFSHFDIEHALDNGQLEVFYQPKINLQDGAITGAEALIRWQHPKTGMIRPDEFLSGIESTRGLRSLARFVLNASLRQAAEWSKHKPGFSISVNLSPNNLDDPDLLEIVQSALRVWDCPRENLTLEITENAFTKDSGFCMTTLKNLQSMGINVSIDDFGTGYSSLSYLKDLPADEVKIDRSLIKGVAHSERDTKIVAAMIQLAQAVNLRVVAEGIEDEETVEILLEHGCDAGQGYHFSTPLSAAEFEERLYAECATNEPESV